MTTVTIRRPRSAHPLAGGNVFSTRACELLDHLDRGALVLRGRPWVVTLAGRRIDTMPNALAEVWIARGFIAPAGGMAFGITAAGREALILAAGRVRSDFLSDQVVGAMQ